MKTDATNRYVGSSLAEKLQQRRNDPKWQALPRTGWMAEALRRPLASIGLTVRIVNALEEAGLQTVFDLLLFKKQELLALNSIGEKTLEEIYASLARLGFYRPGQAPQESSQELVRRRRRKFMEQYGLVDDVAD